MKHILPLAIFLIVFVACTKSRPTEQSVDVTDALQTLEMEGSYTTEDRTADLTISEQTSTTFTFELLVTTEGAHCTGEMGGMASLNKETNQWTFQHNELTCALLFTFNDGMITIEEEGECDHGAACSFTGRYGKTGSFSAAKEEELVLNNLLDYYRALPDNYFTCEMERVYTRTQREAAIQYKNIASGFMTAGFDELDTVQLALFKNIASNESFVALVYECGGGCMCTKRLFLTHDNNGWTDRYAEVFPDLSVLEEGDVMIAFRLPEKGTTISVYNFDTGEALADLQWKNGKFEMVKK